MFPRLPNGYFQLSLYLQVMSPSLPTHFDPFFLDQQMLIVRKMGGVGEVELNPQPLPPFLPN